ncbi:MAG: helix-turn-helix domain-containing protein, partial [Acidimicrobiales bacterium]
SRLRRRPTEPRTGATARGAPRLTLTVEEAVALLGISRTLAYELVARGDLPCLRLGRRVLISRQALERMVHGSGRPA